MNLGRRDILKAIAGSVAATFLGGIQLGEEDRERNRLRELRGRVIHMAGDLYIRVGEYLVVGTAGQVLTATGGGIEWRDAVEAL